MIKTYFLSSKSINNYSLLKFTYASVLQHVLERRVGGNFFWKFFILDSNAAGEKSCLNTYDIFLLYISVCYLRDK